MTEASGVYAIVHRESGNLYVGSAINIAARCYGHLRALEQQKHANRLLQAAWNEHGADAFVFVTIRTCEKSRLNSEEQRWLDEFGAGGPDCYNINPNATTNRIARVYVPYRKSRPTTPDDIKALRARLGLTQAALAARVGVTIAAVQHWERGIRTPSGSAVKMLKRVGKNKGKGKGPAKEQEQA